jgi:L-2-hydroxyglutarate oxidase LhgO
VLSVPVWTPRSRKFILVGLKSCEIISDWDSKSFQKILAKQGLKFKLNTKVLGATRQGETVSVKVDSAKGGKEETVRFKPHNVELERT